MVKTDATNVEPLLEGIRAAIKSAEDGFKSTIILFLGNLSQVTDRVIPLLEAELTSETDPEIRSELQRILDSARKNAATMSNSVNTTERSGN